MSSICYATANVGNVLGSLMVTVLHTIVSPENMIVWGWRVAFMSSAIIGLLGIFLQRYAHESPEFEKVACSDKIKENPLIMTLKHHKISCLIAIGVVCLNGLIAYTSTIWIPLLVTTLTPDVLDKGPASLILTSSLLFVTLLHPLFGYIADRIGMYTLMFAGAIGIGLLVIPLMYSLSHPTITWYIIYQLALTIPTAAYGAPLGAWMVQSFPVEVRYSAVSVGYNLAIALFGGTVALVNTALYSKFQSPIPVGIYICAMTAFSLISLVLAKNQTVKNYKKLELARSMNEQGLLNFI